MPTLFENPFWNHSPWRTNEERDAEWEKLVATKTLRQMNALEELVSGLGEHLESLPASKQKEIDRNLERIEIRFRRRDLLAPDWNRN